MHRWKKILLLSTAGIVLFVLGGIVGAKFTVRAVADRNTLLQPINHLKNVKKTTDLISDRGIQAHVEQKSSLSALALAKVNLNWLENSFSRKQTCSELIGIQAAFNVLKTQLDDMDPESSALKDIDQLISHFEGHYEQCESNNSVK